MRNFFLITTISCSMILTACMVSDIKVEKSEVTPSTYQSHGLPIKRSVGMLRRLLILPARIDFSPENTNWCPDNVNWDVFKRAIANDSLNYLARDRGYEVITTDPSATNHQIIAIPHEELENLNDQLIEYGENYPEGVPPTSIANFIKKIGNNTKVDGIVIIHGSFTELTWIDDLSWIGSFALTIPISMARIGIRLKSEIFEVATGKLVWAAAVKVGGQPIVSFYNHNPITGLFDNIEPAVPKVLIAP